VAVAPGVDRGAVVAGALAGLALAVPAIVTFQVIEATADLDEDSNLVFPFFLVVVAGWVVAGAVAGRRRPDTPLTHGALAAAAGYGVVLVVGLVLALARGDELPVVEFVFNTLVAASAGVLGGIVSTRRRA
jgi:putative membrane protein (TIGR04086 family)